MRAVTWPRMANVQVARVGQASRVDLPLKAPSRMHGALVVCMVSYTYVFWCLRACSCALRQVKLSVCTCPAAAHVGGSSRACVHVVRRKGTAAHTSCMLCFVGKISAHVGFTTHTCLANSSLYYGHLHPHNILGFLLGHNLLVQSFLSHEPNNFLFSCLFYSAFLRPRFISIQSRFTTLGLYLGGFSLITFRPRTLANMS